MALGRRQARLYTYRASIYKPLALAAGGDIEAPEEAIDTTPEFVNVPGLYSGTPEVDNATFMGLTKEQNLVTFDSWCFEASQPLADAWIIEMTASDPRHPPHPLIGRFWIVRDNPQVVASQGRRRPDFIMVFGVLSNVPGLSGKVNNIS